MVFIGRDTETKTKSIYHGDPSLVNVAMGSIKTTSDTNMGSLDPFVQGLVFTPLKNDIRP